ncbi:RNA polymerase sigma factor [Mucilaginibacter terrae]|uniref:RNA polymerase sigma factor (Sigma-70 family) n=1 Tax=Mucilaginibacter terrae TaxID=1955052 RepID=A0ABU3H0H9_9SPHI|nr:sigma-70 family RNA polymerase sigma factor [Mucilaginibacter terrae]MDT3405527.1 RNA polymerase sigma factor (sigma-70 family) [Mucilaginibacter terrae]
MGETELNSLIKLCLKEDRKGQKMLYKAFYGFAMGISLRYAGNRYEAAEIMNQAFLKVFTNLHKFDHAKPFKAWLGRITMNTAIDYYRSNLKMAYMDDLEKAEHITDNELPDKRINYQELLAMIQQLPQAYRTVFNLYAIEGYTHEEIGEMLGINEGTSKSNLFKAREKLKKMILKAAEIPENGTSGTSQSQIVAISTGNLHLSFLNSGIRR